MLRLWVAGKKNVLFTWGAAVADRSTINGAAVVVVVFAAVAAEVDGGIYFSDRTLNFGLVHLSPQRRPSQVMRRRVLSISRSWAVLTSTLRRKHAIMNEWCFLLTCDKKLTKSQLSPTHASTIKTSGTNERYLADNVRAKTNKIYLQFQS